MARRWFRGGGKKRRAKFAIGKIELSMPPPPTSPHCAPRFFSLDLAQPRVTIPSDLAANLTSPPRGPPARSVYVGVSLTRVRVCRAAWRRTVRNMCTIKYTQKCLLSLALSCLRPPFLSVAHLRGVTAVACVRAHVQVYASRVCFQHRISAISTGVPCTRYTSSMLAISQHDKFFQPAPRDSAPFSLFPLRGRAQYVHLFRPADKKDVTRRRRNPADGFIHGKWASPTREECRTNRIMSFLFRERE